VFRPDWTHKAMAKVAAGKEKIAIAELEALYADFNPGFLLEYEFLDQNYQTQYAAEQRVASLASYFAILTIFLSCLGLFGLAIFNAETRVKEIGIRKVLGASVIGLVGHLSKDFVQLVALAFLIATPLAYYFMNQWLDNFAYSIDIQWSVFASAGLAAIGIALLTVSFQSMKAALANPVESLRNE
ncbi:MAG: FtsX-like permease family protein, partial [Bacteroidota bacterium]